MILASVYAPVGVVLATATGILGAILGLVRLRGDTNSQAVSQAEGAAEVMQAALTAVTEQRDYWRARYERDHERLNDCAARILELERENRELRSGASSG